MHADASGALTDLEQKLADAATRYARTPGALWLAATAIIESASRLGETLPGALEARRAELLVSARRARDDAGPRSSENDVSAITVWVELAEKRAVLERGVKAALATLATHRAEHVTLGPVPRTRKALEKALLEREKDVTERDARLAEPQDELERDELELLSERGVQAPPDAGASDAELLARSRAARERLRASPSPWHSSVLFGAAIIALFTIPFVDSDLLRELLAGAVLAGLSGGFVARDRADKVRRSDLFEAYAMRRRDQVRASAAKEDHARLVAAGRALGALDAFGATSEGRTLEEREGKLVALAPWIREMVDGFDADEAARFA